MLTSEHITLRAVEPEDLEWLYKWENDTSIWQVSNTIVPFSRYVLHEYLKTAQDDIYTSKQLRLMIDALDPKTTVGSVDLFDFDPYFQRAGVGILIAESTHRGQGYAGEALGLLVGYAFKSLKLHQLYCNIATDNAVSLGLFQKYGFVITGEKKDWLQGENGWKNEYLLQLINPST